MGFGSTIKSFFARKDNVTNKFNEAFLQWFGAKYATYDRNDKTYMNEGYGNNSDVFAIIQQMTQKTISIPYYVKRIKDYSKKQELNRLKLSTKQDYSMMQYVKSKILETKAFEGDALDFPLDKPNPNQTWSDILGLYKTYLRTTGNFYLYMLSPKEGVNAGTPIQCYVLPSYLMQIVVKDGCDLLGVENPIKGYILREGDQYVEFEEEEVIHVKLTNPFFDFQGSHLYGLSPLHASLDNIQSSNEAMSNNIKTLKNSGAFGFLHSKNTPLTEPQAKEMKSRLSEMDASPDRMSKIAGVSSEIGFTRISLTTDELKPFDYLKYDQKAICNALGWSDKLLNNDDGSKYDNVNSFRKQVITDNIIPDLRLLEEALRDKFLPRFKGYQGTVIEFDYSELPEMQQDMKTLTEWLNNALDRAVINKNEYRAALRYDLSEDKNMEVFTTSQNMVALEEVLIPQDNNIL